MGNVNFDGGFSRPANPGDAPDNINNVECVYVENPAGIYTVRVFAPPSFDVSFAVPDTSRWSSRTLRRDRTPGGADRPRDPDGSIRQHAGFGIRRTSGRRGGACSWTSAAGRRRGGRGQLRHRHAPPSSALAAIGDRAAKQAATAAANAIAFGGCTFMGGCDRAVEAAPRDGGQSAAGDPPALRRLRQQRLPAARCGQAVRHGRGQGWRGDAGACVRGWAGIGPGSCCKISRRAAAVCTTTRHPRADLNEVYGFIRAELNDVAVVVSRKIHHVRDRPHGDRARRSTGGCRDIRGVMGRPGAATGAGSASQGSDPRPHPRSQRPERTSPRHRRTDLSRDGHVTVHLNHPMPGKWRVLISTGAGTRAQCTATVFVRVAAAPRRERECRQARRGHGARGRRFHPTS